MQYDFKFGGGSSQGDVHVGLVGGKIVIGVEDGFDLKAQLDKLAAAHQSGVLGAILKVANAGIAAAENIGAQPAQPAPAPGP